MSMKHQIIAAAVLAAFAGCVVGQAPREQPPGAQAQASGASTAVYEAVVRYQIKSWEFGADSYCIRIKGKDADKQFLQRLRPLPVKGASECIQKQNKSFTMSVIDKHTKRSSVIFGLGDILWRKETEAEVEGGYLCGSQCMAGGIYHVVWDGERWRVTAYDVRISQ